MDLAPLSERIELERLLQDCISPVSAGHCPVTRRSGDRVMSNNLEHSGEEIDLGLPKAPRSFASSS